MTEQTIDPSRQAVPGGIGGWLAVVAIGVVLAPFTQGYRLVLAARAMFVGDIWDRLTDPASPAYHALWAPVLRLELVADVVLVALALAVAVSFFRRSAVFAKLGVTFWSLQIALAVGERLLLRGIPGFETSNASLAPLALVLEVGSRALAITYVLRSRRVRNTFRARA